MVLNRSRCRVQLRPTEDSMDVNGFRENQRRLASLRWFARNPGNFQLVLMRLSRRRSTREAANQLSQSSIRISRDRARRRSGIYNCDIAKTSAVHSSGIKIKRDQRLLFFCRSSNVQVLSSISNHRLQLSLSRVIKKRTNNDVVRNKSEH